MADMQTHQPETESETESAEPLNRAERRAQRKGKNGGAQQRQFGLVSEQNKGHRAQVVGPRQFAGKRGNR